MNLPTLNLPNSEKKRVIIYYDEGVSRQSFESAIQFFKKNTHDEVLAFSSVDVCNLDWEKSCKLFIVPGGRDIPYQKKLEGLGIKKIRSFVENGGTYIGICAGAYFASSKFIFEKGTPLEIIAKRDLGFFKGVAIGPALGVGVFRYDSEEGASYPPITFLGSKKIVNIYYNGGASFSLPKKDQDTKIIAVYPNQEAAIIECKVKLGKAILSGVHFEMNQDEIELFKNLALNSLDRDK